MAIPANEPLSMRAGDTWKWTRTFDDYPAPTWTLKYRFKNATSYFEIVATPDGTTHSVSVAAATTATYGAGSYTWMAWVEGGTSEKYTVDTGTATIDPDYRASTAAYDGRSHARKMLDAIESWLENHDPAVAEYEIAGRRMKYIPITELIAMRSRYRLEVQSEDNAAAIAKGEGLGRKIQFRV